MSEIALNRSSLLSTDMFRATATGLQIVGEPTYDEWYQFGENLARVDGAIQWWIGDWAAAEGRVVNGVKSEAYDLLEESTGLGRSSVRQCRDVAERVDLDTRVSSLSWSHHRQVAWMDADDQKRWLQSAVDEGLSVNQLRRQIRAAAYQEPDLPDGKYRIIYADPPWFYTGDQHGTLRGITAHSIGSQDMVLETHYPSMTTEQLCELNVSALAAVNAVLFLWATAPLIREALQVMEAWGFDYKAQFVWDKVRHNVGHYNSVRHELLLIGGRGAATPDIPELVDSVYAEERTEHSRKPGYFRDLIDRLYPHGTRVELFARGDLSGSWIGMGNEYAQQSS